MITRYLTPVEARGIQLFTGLMMAAFAGSRFLPQRIQRSVGRILIICYLFWAAGFLIYVLWT